MSGARRIGRGAGLIELVADLAGVLLQLAREDGLHRLGDAQVQPLAARQRQAGEQGLADLLVHEAIAGDAILGDVLDQPLLARPPRWRRARRPRRAQVRLEQQIEVEGAARHRGDGEDVLAELARAPDPVLDDQPHAARDLGVGDLDVVAELAGFVEELAGLLQVADHLLDEEGVALGLRHRELDQVGRRLRSELADEQLHDLGAGKPLQPQVLDQPLAGQLLQRAAERAAVLELALAVGADQQHRLVLQTLGEVAEQDAGELVRPVQVLEHQHQRLHLGAARRRTRPRRAADSGAPAPAAGSGRAGCPHSAGAARASACRARGRCRPCSGACPAAPEQPGDPLDLLEQRLVGRGGARRPSSGRAERSMPASRARRSASVVMRVLPTPASPEKSRKPPSPRPAVSIASSIRSSSRPRPTQGKPRRRAGGGQRAWRWR